MSDSFQKVQALRGMNDLLPSQSFLWEKLEDILSDWAHRYGYQNIRTPLLEQTRLFARGIGEVTDIVEKEMYTFSMTPEPTADDMMTLRPEFTAGICRAVIQHNLLYDRPQKLFSMGPLFRHERPQKGRYRMFHQISVEAMGYEGPDMDAEQIIMLARLWKELGLKDIHLELNSLGSTQERLAHRQALIAHLEKHKDILDEDGLRRMYSNPLRVLDTKNPKMQEMANEAPKLFEYLGDESKKHFDSLCNRLSQQNIEYKLNPRLVRGLDYYNLTVFEWITNQLGAQSTVCGGGRYDGLIGLLGGKPTPAVGFGLGIERLIELWTLEQNPLSNRECDIYIVHLGETASLQALTIAEQCRDMGWKVIVHAGSGSFKSQFKRADASGARIALILGQDEVDSQTIGIKPLRTEQNDNMTTQITVSQANLVQEIRTRTSEYGI